MFACASLQFRRDTVPFLNSIEWAVAHPFSIHYAISYVVLRMYISIAPCKVAIIHGSIYVSIYGRMLMHCENLQKHSCWRSRCANIAFSCHCSNKHIVFKWNGSRENPNECVDKKKTSLKMERVRKRGEHRVCVVLLLLLFPFHAIFTFN